MFEKEAEDSFKCKKVLYKWETDKHSYIDGFEDGAEFGYNKCNTELEKENKFLKEQCLILADGNVCSSTCSEIKKQLSKAKELIRDLLQVLPKENIEGVYEITEEAEQFIRED